MIAIVVMPISDHIISDGSGRCIGYRCFGDDHVSGDDIVDEDISDHCLSESYQ